MVLLKYNFARSFLKLNITEMWNTLQAWNIVRLKTNLWFSCLYAIFNEVTFSREKLLTFGRKFPHDSRGEWF